MRLPLGTRPLLLLALLAAGAGALLGVPGERPAAGAGRWKTVGSAGLNPGQFKQPRGIAGLPDGSFFVVDRAARVQRFDAAGRPAGIWEMRERALGNPKGLCALPNGNLLVCDTHYGRVLEMTLAGETAKVWGTFGTGPAQFVHPLSCVADARRGAAYVVEYGGYNDRVQKFSLDGTFLKAWGSFGCEPGQFRRPSGVAVDSRGSVYVADAANHRIQKFDPDGGLLSVFGEAGHDPGQLSFPFDIACAADDTLYVADYNNHRVSVFDAEGAFLRVLGGPGGGEGEFRFPWSLSVHPDGRLLVSDTGNSRVQILALPAPTERKALTPPSLGGIGRTKRTGVE